MIMPIMVPNFSMENSTKKPAISMEIRSICFIFL